jgi:uncharacterized protein YkwD
MRTTARAQARAKLFAGKRANSSKLIAKTTANKKGGSKKVRLILLILGILFIGVVGTAYLNYVETQADIARAISVTDSTQNVVTAAPTDVNTRLLKEFNKDRREYQVSPVIMDVDLSGFAFFRAGQMITDRATDNPYYTHEDLFVISREEWQRSYYHSPEEIVDILRNTDMKFRNNELNPDNTIVGIGSVEFGGFYFVSVEWK